MKKKIEPLDSMELGLDSVKFVIQHEDPEHSLIIKAVDRGYEVIAFTLALSSVEIDKIIKLLQSYRRRCP